MRSEIDLTSYRFENIVFHLLHHRYVMFQTRSCIFLTVTDITSRIPHYSYRMLTSWYRNGGPTLKEKVCRYYLDRVQRNLELLDVSNMLSRTTESARTFGIDFYSVITRGSQFKVESMMLRIAKPENFILISPSRKQV
jgi:DNA polymerase zeta